MNRYPLWKYIVIVVALVIGLVYTLPNFYGESPAVQVSSGKATVKVTEQTLKTVEDLLRNADLHPNGIFFEQGAQQNTVRVRFEPTEAEKQLQAREVLEKALNPNREDPAYVVALNLTPNTPQWLLSIRARCRCISALTFAAAYTSCFRSTCARPLRSAPKRRSPTFARSFATSASATRA